MNLPHNKYILTKNYLKIPSPKSIKERRENKSYAKDLGRHLTAEGRCELLETNLPSSVPSLSLSSLNAMLPLPREQMGAADQLVRK
jgi:hypothetical protein